MELKIEAKNLELQTPWQQKIEEERAKLIRHYANFVLHLRVTIASTPGYKEGGYEVRLVASVPSDTVAVKRWGENVRSLLVEAFDVLNAQLKERVKKKQQHKAGKTLAGLEVETEHSGFIHSLTEANGLIIAQDKSEVSFQAKALKDISLNELREGDAVIFAAIENDKGLEASWVRKAAA